MANESIVIKAWVQRLKTWFGSNRKTAWLLLIGVCGMALIGASTWWDRGDEPKVDVTSQTERYAADLEERLETMVSSIRGVGQSHVTVMLENGVEYVYANEEKTNSDHSQNTVGDVSVSDDNQRTVVTVDAADGKIGLLVTEIQPTVRGVVVACEGGDNDAVAALVKEAVVTALDIGEKHVCVIPYNTERE